MYRADLADRPTSRPALRSEHPEPVAGLLDELARAMLVAAEHERDRLVASVVDEADAQAHKVRARAVAEAAESRHLADEDSDEIHARAVAEIERIRTRAERRIAVRRGRLERHLVGHASIIESEIERIDTAVQEYGRELDGFFGRLRGQREPREIARLAGRLPATPDFDALRADARAKAVAPFSGVPVATTVTIEASVERPRVVVTAQVGAMDREAAQSAGDTGTVARFLRSLAAWTSSNGRGT